MDWIKIILIVIGLWALALGLWFLFFAFVSWIVCTIFALPWSWLIALGIAVIAWAIAVVCGAIRGEPFIKINIKR